MAKSRRQVPKLDQRLTGAGNIDDEIQMFLDLLLRDYVNFWFDEMTSHQACPTEMRRMIQHMTVVVSNHCKMVDWVGLLTGPFIEELKGHIRRYREAQIAASAAADEESGVAGGKDSRDKKDDRKDRKEDMKDKKDREKLNITDHPSMASLLEDFFFEKDDKFAEICRDEKSETIYCRNVAEVLCFLLLPEDDFSDRTTRLMLREMLTKSSLLYSANIFSDPDYVNQTIAMGIENSYLSFQALKAAADYCSLDELEAIKENIDLDISFRLKDEKGQDQSVGIAERAQKNKKEIEELLALKRHCERRIQLFATGQKEADELAVDGSGLSLPDPSLSEMLEDDGARAVFGNFLETLHALPLLAFWRAVEWYRQCESGNDEVTAGFTIGTTINAAEGYAGGTVRYVGPCVRTGELRIGVELSEPVATEIAAEHGERHDALCFECPDNTGVLFRPSFLQSFKPVVTGVPTIVQGVPVATGTPAPTSATSEAERRVRARGVNEMFLKSNVGQLTQHLGLPEDITSKINTRIADDRYRVHLSLFDDAQQHIYRHLESVCLPQFKATKHYDEAVEGMAARFGDDGGDDDGMASAAAQQPDSASGDNQRDSTVGLSATEPTDNLFAPESFEVGGQWRAALTEACEINEGPKKYTAYVIKVVYISPQGDRREWKTQRRYSEFDSFHKLLQKRFEFEVESVELSLPSKKLFGNMSRDFIQKRGEKLIQWLAMLTSSAFLNRNAVLVQTISKFLMHGAFAKEAKKKKKEAARRVAGAFVDGVAGRRESMFYGDDDDYDGGEDMMPLRIMLSLFDEIFEIKGNRWSRRAVKGVTGRVLRGFFGDRVNDMVHDGINHAIEPDQVAANVKNQRENAWWPDGTLAPDPQPREHGSQVRTQIEARAKIFGLLPDELKPIVGPRTAKLGVNNLFEMFQNRRFTKRLVFAMMEMVLLKMFPGHFEKVFEQTHMHVSKAQGDEQPSREPSGPERSSSTTPQHERTQTGATGAVGLKQRGHTRTGSTGAARGHAKTGSTGTAPARHRRTGSMG